MVKSRATDRDPPPGAQKLSELQCMSCHILMCNMGLIRSAVFAKVSLHMLTLLDPAPQLHSSWGPLDLKLCLYWLSFAGW